MTLEHGKVFILHIGHVSCLISRFELIIVHSELPVLVFVQSETD